MKNLIELKNIVKQFRMKDSLLSFSKEITTAVDSVNLTLRKGEVHGIVGESGCGKTTLARIMLGLEKPTSGSVFFKNTDLTQMNKTELKNLRKTMQVIFQDPYASLNPRMTVEDIVSEPLIIHSLYADKNERRKKVISLLENTGLCTDYLNRYPHEFSGGQRQRIGIARSLALSPEIIIADEPVSALDVSIQAQILNLLKQLKSEFNLSYLFISHDFSVMRFLCDRITVMYSGRIIETASADSIFANPQHPYTEMLLSAVPKAEVKKGKSAETVFQEENPEIKNSGLMAKGCCFRNRCRYKTADCEVINQKLMQFRPYHYCACSVMPFADKPSASAVLNQS